MSLIAQYTPDQKDTYGFVRTLAYRAKLSAGLIIDAAQYFLFALVGASLVTLIMGTNPKLFLDWEVARVMGLTLSLVFIGLLLWQLFRVWSLAPTLDEPENTEIKISKIENGLHFSSQDFDVNLSFDKIILYFVDDHFIAIKQRYGSAIIIDIRIMSADNVSWLKEKLAETATETSFWNAYKMLAG